MPDKKKLIDDKIAALKKEMQSHTDAAQKLNKRIRLLEELAVNPDAHADVLDVLK